ncbi:hypothetical protein LWC35_34805 [Pseudonocardia kujensis]|uniref:hypothetical protein n=1 Tax=Pseudonocardia kujensis TaxID=1128675 RepID=UPI001E4FCD22|nr:hypothetical protein [Pseudonocardia kujensis]MCE0768033.1 hypothetical protein [Pseudonocardia kujensis]
MHIAWGALGAVALVSLVAGVAVIALVAFALVGLSARSQPAPVGRRGLSPAAGTAVAGLCLAAAALIVGYGLYVIVA